MLSVCCGGHSTASGTAAGLENMEHRAMKYSEAMEHFYEAKVYCTVKFESFILLSF